MSYKKSLKGDSNQANEEFSHNRIIVNMGASGVIAVCFTFALLLAAIGWMVIHYGWLISTMLILATVGAALYGASFLVERASDVLTKIQQNKLRSRTITAPPEHQLAYLPPEQGSEWYNPTAEIVAAGIPRLLPAPKDEPAFLPDEQSFIDIYNSSNESLKELAQRFGNMTYYQAQKIYTDAKKQGLITR